MNKSKTTLHGHINPPPEFLIVTSGFIQENDITLHTTHIQMWGPINPLIIGEPWYIVSALARKQGLILPIQIY